MTLILDSISADTPAWESRLRLLYQRYPKKFRSSKIRTWIWWRSVVGHGRFMGQYARFTNYWGFQFFKFKFYIVVLGLERHKFGQFASQVQHHQPYCQTFVPWCTTFFTIRNKSPWTWYFNEWRQDRWHYCDPATHWFLVFSFFSSTLFLNCYLKNPKNKTCV